MNMFSHLILWINAEKDYLHNRALMFKFEQFQICRQNQSDVIHCNKINIWRLSETYMLREVNLGSWKQEKNMQPQLKTLQSYFQCITDVCHNKSFLKLLILICGNENNRKLFEKGKPVLQRTMWHVVSWVRN